jgi:hypothetical protein
MTQGLKLPTILFPPVGKFKRRIGEHHSIEIGMNVIPVFEPVTAMGRPLLTAEAPRCSNDPDVPASPSQVSTVHLIEKVHCID